MAAKKGTARKPRAKKGGKIYRANTTGSVQVGNDVHAIYQNVTLVREGHPLLKAAPNFFEELTESAYNVEQATAAPGEERER